MLLPAAVLVVVILGAIAVDRALVFSDQRDLVQTAQAAANDAAALGADVEGIRNGETVALDRARIDATLRRTVDLDADAAHPISLTWRLEGDEVVVRLTRTVPRMFTGAIPGTAPTTTVTATARARLVAIPDR